MSSDYTGGRYADLTGSSPMRGAGLPMQWMFAQCGHKGSRAGGTFRDAVPMRCAACTAARKATK